MSEGQLDVLAEPAARIQDSNLRRKLTVKPRAKRTPDRPRGAVRSVDNAHLGTWQSLQDEALCAHQAFVTAARGAALARHRGDEQRADSLTQLAQKQHRRWIDMSRRMTRYES